MPKGKTSIVTDDRAIKAIADIKTMREQRVKTILSGAFDTIENYKAATTNLREYDRMVDAIERHFGEEVDDE